MDNNEEEGKRASRRAPLQLPPRLDEPDPDLGLPMSFQERQRREILLLPTIESDVDEEGMEESEDDYDDYESGSEDYEYFSSRGIDGNLGPLEGEDSSSDFGLMEEDEIDPDDLSYEQLIELGEIIGEEKRGLSAEQVSSYLHPVTYEPANGALGARTDRCVICQVEYGGGEKLVALSCEHPYHSECIGQWLQVKKTCPICSVQVSAPNTTAS